MSLNQVTIEIPLNIQKGLDSGIYKRYGSIIRNSSGHIVKHLKEVKAGEPAQQVVKGLAKNKYVLVTAIGATVLAVGGVGYYAFISNRYKKIVKKLIEKLVHFIQLAQKGEVSEEEVLKNDKLELVLFGAERCSHCKKLYPVIEKLIQSDFRNRIEAKYTIQFAKVNGFETDTISEVAENNKVINLMDYLNLQKTIYRSDAV